MTEQDIQRYILDYLAAKNIFNYRNNSGAVISEYKGKKRMFRFGSIGAPDIVAVINGRYIGIECKSKNGSQSDGQAEFQRRLERAGGVYVLIRTQEDWEREYKHLISGYGYRK